MTVHHVLIDRDDRKRAAKREEGRAGGSPGSGRSWWPVFPCRERAGAGNQLPCKECGQL